jgi:hypothetical protein
MTPIGAGNRSSATTLMTLWWKRFGLSTLKTNFCIPLNRKNWMPKSKFATPAPCSPRIRPIPPTILTDLSRVSAKPLMNWEFPGLCLQPCPNWTVWQDVMTAMCSRAAETEWSATKSAAPSEKGLFPSAAGIGTG